MEVKDIAVKATIVPESPTQSSVKKAAQNQPVQAKGALPIEAVSVNVRNLNITSAIRASSNKAIESVNLAADTVRSVSKLVSSLDGVLEQASSDGLSKSRVDALEKEAKELVSAIRERIKPPPPPLAGERIKVDAEAVLGKTLDFILPELKDEVFSVTTVEFSTKDSIMQVRSAVAETRQNMEALRESVDLIRKEVASATSAIDVAIQNSEASKNVVRDVEAAADLAESTIGGIKENPKDALNSIGTLRNQSADLLR